MKRLTKHDYDTLAWALRRYRDHYDSTRGENTGLAAQNYADYLDELLELLMDRAELDNDTKWLYRAPSVADRGK